MSEEREGFVIWIDAAVRGSHGLRGAAEWTRSAQRVEFDSALELERFLERCIASRAPWEGDTPGRSEAIVQAESIPDDTNEREVVGESEYKP